MTDLRNRLNIHGIVDLDQMAAILASLVEQLDRQNTEISELKKQLSSYVTYDCFNNRISTLENIVTTANVKIDAIQEAATATAMNKKISAGHLASSNFKHICNLTNLILDCATKVELVSQKKELDGVHLDISDLRRDFDNSLGMIDGLSKSQFHQSERIGSLETSVAGKIDRSECDHLQSLVAKVLLYDSFKNDTVKTMDLLLNFRDDSLDRHNTIQSRLFEISEELRKVWVDLDHTATLDETKLLAQELNDLRKGIDNCATLELVSEEIRAGTRRDDVLETCNDQLKNQHCLIENLQREIEEKATLRAVRECVSRRHYDQAITALGVEIDQKAAHTMARDLKNKLEALENRLSTDEERLSVAMRFVEWFTSRGENYEHNLQIIDKHLKGLVVSPAPSQGVLPLGPNAASVSVPGLGVVSAASTGTSSSVHSYFIPGNRSTFLANHSHAP